MPYKIKYKSHNSCLIKFKKNKGPRRKKRINLSLIVLGIIAVIIGIHFLFVMIGFFAIGLFFNKPAAPRSDFEIEFNRRKNQIVVRKSDKIKPKSMIYPLSSLKGFGFHQLSVQSKSRRASPKHAALATLFFEFDSDIFLDNGETESPLIRNAPQVTEVDGEHFWQVPLQKDGYIIPVSDAVEIIKSMDDWFMQHDTNLEVEDIPILETQTPEPESEPEILRDFRDME